MKNKNFFIYFIVTFIFFFTLFIIKYINDTKNDYQVISEKILFQQASTLFNNIVTLRKWNSDHGSIYVKEHDGLKPNPYLKDNHDYTKNNELLIKINPAWMTRQISELSNQSEKFYFKITSLNPKNPANAPDAFEKIALEELNKNKSEEFYTRILNDKYNLMGTLRVEPSCLNCHQEQNYEIGDVLGGLRVSVPIDNYLENIEIVESKSNILYLITIFTSISFIVMVTFTINSIYTRELNILKLNKTLENKVNQRTKELRLANKKLLEISNIDYLTNIPNRRCFFETGLKSFYLAKEKNSDLSIICIDIDYFKSVNDTYGHNIGDEILKLVVKVIEKFIRKSDILARTGGEEFTILLNNMNENNAFILAEKLRIAVENSFYDNDSIKIKTTISLGISQIKKDDEDLDSIISRADKALYLAKEGNRNKSVIYS
ncbi:MAG: diguanylate cyclase [Aliarcobacter sp.]|nr:diguanylate cyclase [Aliarcobacter sp.]